MEAQRLAREIVYQSPWINLYLDKVRFPNGLIIEKYHLLDFPNPAVTAIVENNDGEVIFAKVCRYTTGRTEWELPAGGVNPGESIIEAARREVLEETGYTSQDHQLIYTYYPMNGIANKQFHILHCKAIELVGDFDHDEVSETRWFNRAEIHQMLKARAFTDGFTLTALLLWLQDSEKDLTVNSRRKPEIDKR
jgi:ADP-ribose pyrophosphatase